MTQKAWEIDREIRVNAVPLDRRIHDSNWYEAGFEAPYGDGLIALFWDSKVPGSGAPEIPYVEMVQALSNKGYDVSAAEALLPEGLKLFHSKDVDGLRTITARILNALNQAPKDPASDYHQCICPANWPNVRAAMGKITEERDPRALDNLSEKIYHGWIGQLAGGSFGTAIEGYTGDRITQVYGTVDSYITEPETTNDDVVYELVLLDVFEHLGRDLTSVDLGLEWVGRSPLAGQRNGLPCGT